MNAFWLPKDLATVSELSRVDQGSEGAKTQTGHNLPKTAHIVLFIVLVSC